MLASAMPAESALSGLALARAFYAREIAPLLALHFPRLAHAAGLIGPGSEVLGYDSQRSRDHHWGPRALLFLRDGDLLRDRAAVHACLADHLPHSFEGFATNFGDPVSANGVRLMAPTSSGPVQHLIEILSVRGHAKARLGIDTERPLANRDWLALPQQRLLETTKGEIFHDAVGEITALRARLAYFPDDVWRYMLASQWQKISQEEAFVGRTAEAGDPLGSRLVAARLVREMMRLCFLIEKRYWPYAKWFGTAFAELEIAAQISPSFDAALAAGDFAAREAALARAYEVIAARHNRLGVTPPLDPTVRLYHGRPFRVIGADRFAAAVRATIGDSQLRALDLFGAADQFVDSTDVLEKPGAFGATGAVYGP